MKKMILSFILGTLSCFLVLATAAFFQGNKNKAAEVDLLKAYQEAYLVELYKKSVESFNQKDFKKALSDLKTYEKQELALKGEVRAQITFRKACLASLAKIDDEIAKNPTDYKLYIKRGDIFSEPASFYLKDGKGFCSDPYFAYLDYSKALELNDRAKGVYQKRAKIIWDTGMSENTPPKFFSVKKFAQSNIEDYKKAIEIEGKTKDLVYMLADSYYLINDTKSALDVLESIKEETPDYYSAKALCYYKDSKLKEASELIDKALELNYKNDIMKANLYKMKSEIELKRFNIKASKISKAKSEEIETQWEKEHPMPYPIPKP